MFAPLDKVEAALRPGGAPVTIRIRILWIELADRAEQSESADLQGTAVLATMTLGLGSL